MKILAVNGSPRPDGNTAFLLNTLLKAARECGMETVMIQLGGNAVHGCTACGKCRERNDGFCIRNNDPVNSCLQEMYEADAIVLGSPSYFSGMTPELKALIDRAGFAAGDRLTGKIGAAVAAHRRGGAVNVVDAVNHMFLMRRMIVPGSTYWNFGVGCAKGEVEQDAEAIANMEDLGRTIAWLAKAIRNTPRT